MGKAIFTFGLNFDNPEHKFECTTESAIAQAKQLPGKGYVWKRFRGHHKIVGNYQNGRAFNGQAQCVDATAGDWDALARTNR